MDLGENVLVAGVTIYNRIDGNICHALEVSSRLSHSILSLHNLEGDTVKTLKIGNARDVPVFDIRFDSYIGCFIDSSERDLTYFVGEFSVNGQIICIQACHSAGYQYAGTQASGQCWCGNSYGSYGVDPNGCIMSCQGNPEEMCGGPWRNSVYRTLPATPVNPTSKPASSAVTSKPTTPYYCLYSKLSLCLGGGDHIWYARFWSTLSSHTHGRGTPPYRLVVDDYCGIVIYDKMDIAIYDDSYNVNGDDDNVFYSYNDDNYPDENDDICDFCGNGWIGNGNCPGLGSCCSSSGYCGFDLAYCGVGRARNCDCGGGNIGNGVCPNRGECCSPWGWCGTGDLYCVSNPCGGGYRGNGICTNSGDCCSQWGWCGTGVEYCGHVSVSMSKIVLGIYPRKLHINIDIVSICISECIQGSYYLSHLLSHLLYHFSSYNNIFSYDKYIAISLAHRFCKPHFLIFSHKPVGILRLCSWRLWSGSFSGLCFSFYS